LPSPASTAQSPGERLRAAAYASARFFRENPRKVRFSVTGIILAGEKVQILREQHLKLMVDMIDSARAELLDPDSVSRAVAESIVGSIFGVLLKSVNEQGDARSAESFVSDLMYIAVRPYFGHAEALKELSVPPPPERTQGAEAGQKQIRIQTERGVQSGANSRYRPSVPKRDSSGGESGSGLPRLPPGRHGLSREFVSQNQRDRLTAGIISAVAKHGYQDATISQIAAAAGVSRRTFYTYFSSKEECFFHTYDLIAVHLLEAAEAEASREREWPNQVRARIAAALECFAANPDLAHFYLVAPPRAGEKIAARNRLSVGRVLAVLTAGIPRDVQAPSEAVQSALVGGIVGLVVHKVEAGEGKRLPELLPDLVALFLTPYLGREEAARLARAAP